MIQFISAVLIFTCIFVLLFVVLHTIEDRVSDPIILIDDFLDEDLEYLLVLKKMPDRELKKMLDRATEDQINCLQERCLSGGSDLYIVARKIHKYRCEKFPTLANNN
jgi:hypothetical protein